MKTYKTITDFGIQSLYIEHFNTLEAAKENFEKAIEDEAETVYLVEEEVHYDTSNDSVNKVLAKYWKKN